MLTTQNNSFGPTEISYLENRFTNMALSTDRFHVRNGNDPNPGNVTEEKESELEDFIEYSKMVLGVLGYKIFVPLVKPNIKIVDETTKNLTFYISKTSKKSNKKIEAKCIKTNEGFVLLKGSKIETKYTPSTPQTIKLLIDKHKNNGDIINDVLNKTIFLQVHHMLLHLY